MNGKLIMRITGKAYWYYKWCDSTVLNNGNFPSVICAMILNFTIPTSLDDFSQRKYFNTKSTNDWPFEMEAI